MKQEEKNLLLKDLCTRLPYGVVCTDLRHGDSRITEIDTVSEVVYFDDVDEYVEIKNIRPYLRPMSSMTPEEKAYYRYYISRIIDGILGTIGEYIDWLNSRHFDYRGLIEKGLAIEVTKKNNPYKY